MRLGLLVYKSELARVRVAQLGTVQTVVKDRTRTAMFTLPWRKGTTIVEEDDTTAPAGATGPGTPTP